MLTQDTLTLTMFDGGAGAGAGAAGAAGAAAGGEAGAAPGAPAAPQKAGKEDLSGVVFGKADEATPQAAQTAAKPTERKPDPASPDERAARFEAMIKGEFAEDFSKRTQQIVDQRFKETKALKDRMTQLTPSLELLAKRYGVDPADPAKLAEAIQNDDSYYEDEAIQRGLTVEQLKQIKQVERENAQYRAQEEERQKQEYIARAKASLDSQIPEVKAAYPDFDMMVELQNPRFKRLVSNGDTLLDAYKSVHADDLISKAAQHTAAQTQQQVVNDIMARGARPTENGISGQAASVIRKADPSTWTRAERDEAERRAMGGEKIRL